MFNKTKLTTKLNSGTLTAASAYSVAGSSQVYVRVREGSTVGVYLSTDNGTTWGLSTSIDATSESIGQAVDVTGATHLDVVRASGPDQKVALYPLSQGLTIASIPRLTFGGEVVHATQATAFADRVSAIESLQLGYRPEVNLPANPVIAAGTDINFGADLSGLDGKEFILFMDGLAMHPSSFALNANDDGRISFTNDLPASSGMRATALVWE
jgi:hypothetical protein